jgi:hypothetical protein
VSFQYEAPDGTILRWEGEYTGTPTSNSPKALAALEQLSKELDGQVVGPLNGPYTDHDHLNSPYSFSVLAQLLLGWDNLKQTGNIPMRPPVPPGAIP